MPSSPVQPSLSPPPHLHIVHPPFSGLWSICNVSQAKSQAQALRLLEVASLSIPSVRSDADICLNGLKWQPLLFWHQWISEGFKKKSCLIHDKLCSHFMHIEKGYKSSRFAHFATVDKAILIVILLSQKVCSFLTVCCCNSMFSATGSLGWLSHSQSPCCREQGLLFENERRLLPLLGWGGYWRQEDR